MACISSECAKLRCGKMRSSNRRVFSTSWTAVFGNLIENYCNISDRYL